MFPSLIRCFQGGNSPGKTLMGMDMAQSSKAEASGDESSYEVFLSFRGPDTRQGFTDFLFHEMKTANIRVFRDKEELHVGKEIADELPEAIEKSKIYIPIFSKGYALSVWCLRELAHMVECKKSKPLEKEIMPIFYDVGTDVVKLKSKLYIDALKQHEKKFGHDMRLKWENALRSVAETKGWELKEQGYWEFIKSVTGEILIKLKTKDKLVPERLVGIDIPVKDVEKLLDVYSQDMRIVLIHGMGGIGKTTLAKIVFNGLNSHFSHCCFLQDVRETSLKSCETLQKLLLSNMFGSRFREEINDVDDGIKVIKSLLSKKKVLIVLDDVSNKEQLDDLAIKHISFGSGSRLIMTTRDRSLVVLPDQTLEYEVKPLDSIQSFELFSIHAFGSNPPPDDYVSLSKQIVSTTGGLPLALKVIGSLLHRRKKASWKDVLHDLREVPNNKIEETLKISYNALDYKQQQIFLDIACLYFIIDPTNAFYMWKDCEYRPDYSIDILVCMSLIKRTDDNKLWMHDQLRDLGRKIVCGEQKQPIKQTRLWDHEMANHIIRTKKEKEAIEAICLGGSASKPYTSEEFSRIPRLRFLKLHEGQLSGDFENQFSELRYMSWHKCPKELLATNFHPSNLVVMDLSYSYINEDWAGWSQIKVAKKLKVLDLSYNLELTKTPDFSDYASLERLILNDCTSLVEVDSSIEKLKCLVYFNANGCRSLGELPKGIGGLEKLEYLDLNGCVKVRNLPESLGRVASLIELDLSYTAITKLPNSIGNLKHLVVLKVLCPEIDELPTSIGNLRKLKSLILSWTKIKELPESIGNLESLLELNVSHTHCMQLPETIGDLTGLKVINVANSPIRDLPQSIVELKELEELRAENCPHLKWEIPGGIWKLSFLRVLHLEYTLITNIPVTIKRLPRLEHLRLDYCSELEPLPELPTSLISLGFGSSSLRWVPNLSNLTVLEDLIYTGHEENRCPLFFQDGPCRESHGFLPPFVSKLKVENHKISAISFRGNFRNLTDLWISECSWKEVQLDGLEHLVKLYVSGLELLEGFAGLSALKRLTQLSLFRCPNLTTIQCLGFVESLMSFEMHQCHKIKSLEVSDLKKLEDLSISECEELVMVEGLDELESLKILDFCICKSLKSFPNVIDSKIPDACHLSVSSCPNFEEDHRGAVFDASFGEYRSSY